MRHIIDIPASELVVGDEGPNLTRVTGRGPEMVLTEDGVHGYLLPDATVQVYTPRPPQASRDLVSRRLARELVADMVTHQRKMLAQYPAAQLWRASNLALKHANFEPNTARGLLAEAIMQLAERDNDALSGCEHPVVNITSHHEVAEAHQRDCVHPRHTQPVPDCPLCPPVCGEGPSDNICGEAVPEGFCSEHGPVGPQQTDQAGDGQ